MARHDRAYGVWHSSAHKGGSKRRGTVRLFNRKSRTGAAPVSRYRTKVGRRDAA